MHKYYRLFFLVLIFLTACTGNKIPDGIIAEDKMTNLLTEIHVIDGSMYTVLQVPDSLYKYGTDKYLKVFKKYHTDSLQFRKSFKYYTENPEKLETMYEEISANIKRKSDSVNKLSLDKINKDNKRRTDSLNKVQKNANSAANAPPEVPAQSVKRAANPTINPRLKQRKRTHADSIP